MDSRLWPCPPCGEIREFFQPSCLDGHTDDGGECPEWACGDCGSAVMLGEVGGRRRPVPASRRLTARYPGSQVARPARARDS